MIKLQFSILISLFILSGCTSGNKALIKVEGNAQGTTYHISYLSNDGINYQEAIDSLLKDMDTSMSTYLPVSLICRINNNDTAVLVDRYFVDVYNKSFEVSEKTGGLFDVTVGPLGKCLGIWFSQKNHCRQQYDRQPAPICRL